MPVVVNREFFVKDSIKVCSCSSFSIKSQPSTFCLSVIWGWGGPLLLSDRLDIISHEVALTDPKVALSCLLVKLSASVLTALVAKE